MRLVINACFGGFNLSKAAVARLVELNDPIAIKYLAEQERWMLELANEPDPARKKLMEGMRDSALFSNMNHLDHERTDPLLLQVVDEMGEAAGGSCSKLKVIEIPDGVDYEIDEYDGIETVHEKHRSWS